MTDEKLLEEYEYFRKIRNESQKQYMSIVGYDKDFIFSISQIMAVWKAINLINENYEKT